MAHLQGRQYDIEILLLHADRLRSVSEPNDGELTHYRADGSAHMVDVSQKPVTSRVATATADFLSRTDVIGRIMAGDLPKGEAISTARIAGILAAKRTHDLIPLCHPLPISNVTIDFVAHNDSIRISATVKTTSQTGVEMEALTAVSVSALTLYDMVKAVDRAAVITSIQVDQKTGGTHDWQRT